jgi:ABC-type spermidine/putrescine transport system permease subunit II
MLDNLLDQSFYEFPSFKVALFSLLLAFVLSSVIAFTYKWTYRGISYSGNFFQAMVLSSIATATVIMAVGNNVCGGIWYYRRYCHHPV